MASVPAFQTDSHPVKVTIHTDLSLLRIELRQEELTLSHLEATLKRLESISGCISEARVDEIRYQYKMQQLRVEHKKEEIRLREGNVHKEGEYAWQRMDLTARAMKRYAMESNEAVIWTVPVVHSRFDVLVDSFAFIRCADYYLSIQRRRRRIYLAKNRHGHRGVVPIRIAHNGKDYVMRQAGEHFLTFGA